MAGIASAALTAHAITAPSSGATMNNHSCERAAGIGAEGSGLVPNPAYGDHESQQCSSYCSAEYLSNDVAAGVAE